MIEDILRDHIRRALKGCSLDAPSIGLEFPSDLSHGDYSTNVALVLAKQHRMSPRDLAEKLAALLSGSLGDAIDRVEVAGPGFINFFLSRSFFTSSLLEVREKGKDFGKNDSRAGEKVLIEYTNPNPFKEFHIGHLMSNTIGEALSRLLEFSRAHVKRANYQGDVGLHVAKAVWGMSQDDGNFPAESDSLEKKMAFLGNAYAFGASAYEESEDARSAIYRINREVYEKNNEGTTNLYNLGRRWSLEKFEEIYATLGTSFDFYFFESQTEKLGRELVKRHLEKGVFELSDGAIVFKGEAHDPSLHTRVFITKDDVPTYEAKDLPLSRLKYEAYPFDLSIIVTAVEQKEYFRVVLKALECIEPELAAKTKHITHGLLMLPTGKMSSRAGSVITGESLLKETIERAREKMTKEYDADDALRIAKDVGVAAIKYSVLKQAIGKNVIFDIDSSVSLDGDSGPYLQYTIVRARSVVATARDAGVSASHERAPQKPYRIERLLYRFPEIVKGAANEWAPHRIVTYLTELAGVFNSFYAEERIVDAADPFSPYKLLVTEAFVETMQNGLYVLGIRIPPRM
jgi:arginyl-tRNA synthetase